VQGAARELLALAEANGDEGEEGALADAKHFLMDALANGPVATKAIKADANGAGLSWPTVRRAQKALGIRPFKRGMKDGWYWRMPDQDEMPPSEDSKMLKHSEDVQQEEVSTFGQVEHLRYKSGVVEVEI
jgi:putative DNA primase/helicase